MTVSVISPSSATLRELQERVDQMQGRPAAQPLATHPAFAGLLALQTGASYGVDSASLAMALMAGPSGDGAWCGVVGSAEFGIEAAAAAGVELSRTILVPDPGDQWLEVTSALIDVLTVVVVKPPARLSEAPKDARRGAPGGSAATEALKDARRGAPGGSAATEAQVSRVSARLRQRGAMLIAWGDWPRCDARLSMTDAEWVGLGRGHGHLQARQATVSVRKGTAPAERRRLWLPDADRVIRRVEATPVPLRRIG